MNKLVLAIVVAIFVACIGTATCAKADYQCGPEICSRQWFCGNASLSAAQQHCSHPIRANYCEVRMCTGGLWYMSWRWWL
jgi:hypothetical protein